MLIYFSYILKKNQDVEEVKRICDIYDWHGKGVLDMYYFMDIFYAMGMNLTKKTCVKYGQTDDVEKKFLPFDEVVALAQQVVKEPEHTGNYHDFVELCKLYDKNENGTMMLAELETFLSLMGKSFLQILLQLSREFVNVSYNQSSFKMNNFQTLEKLIL